LIEGPDNIGRSWDSGGRQTQENRQNQPKLFHDGTLTIRYLMPCNPWAKDDAPNTQQNDFQQGSSPYRHR
jgi:hypothetical protein